MVAVVRAALTVFGPLSMYLYLPALPDLGNDLSTGVSAAQLTMTTCLCGLASGRMIAGPISDRFGRRRRLIVGLVVCTAASVLPALSLSITALPASRLVQGPAGGVGLVIARASGGPVRERPAQRRAAARTRGHRCPPCT